MKQRVKFWEKKICTADMIAVFFLTVPLPKIETLNNDRLRRGGSDKSKQFLFIL